MRKYEKTKEVTFNGQVILVDTLPKEIRDGLELFDEMNADLSEATYRQTVLAIAASSWKNKILNDIAQHLSPPAEEAEVNAVNDEINAEE